MLYQYKCNVTFVMKSCPNFFNTFCNFSKVAFGPDTVPSQAEEAAHKVFSGEKIKSIGKISAMILDTKAGK